MHVKLCSVRWSICRYYTMYNKTIIRFGFCDTRIIKVSVSRTSSNNCLIRYFTNFLLKYSEPALLAKKKNALYKKSTKQFHCHSNESSLWPCLDSKYHPSGRLGPTSNFSFTFHWLLNKRLENKENEHWPQEKEAWSHEQNFLLQNHWQHNRRVKNSVESTNRFNLSWKGFKIIFL